MTIKKGLKTLAENTPDFSNQALENAITDIQTKVNSDWVTKTFTLDTAIRNNTVLTNSQKNDILDDINYIPYLNIGRYLNDVIRHTNTILDGTIVVRTNPDVQDVATFLEILQTVQSIQTLIPNLYNVTAGEKNRDVNDHFGSLNNKFLQTEDSSLPVFDAITENLQQMMRLTSHSSATTAVADGGGLETDIDALLNFINSVVADSTDFQQTLDLHVLQLKNEFIGLHQYLTNLGIYGNHTDIQAIQAQAEANHNAVENQRLLEIANLSGIRDYVSGLTNHIGYTSLAESEGLRNLMVNLSQNADWKNYFADYESNFANINPMYNTDTDSDKASVIDRVLRDAGLPDVIDHIDLDGVANKAKKDDRINTENFDSYIVETIITKCCEQLGISTKNRSIFHQSELLLNNLNDRDRQKIADALDLNESSNTIS
tara:strand:+ start:218 stop:1507 length:1290 start_codon:yes stop_codon:yes gene_type:complete